MSKQVVYRRVSTDKQETDRQFHNTQIKFDLEFEDKLSGKNTHRPQLQLCLSSLEKGDTLFVWEVSRLSRNLTDLRETVLGLIDRGVSVKFAKEGLEFLVDEKEGMKSAMSRMQLNLMGTIAEFERDLIRNRIVEGLAVAKANGKKLGGAATRHRVATQKNYSRIVERDSEYKDYLSKWRDAGLTLQQCADRMNEMGILSPRGSALTPKSVQRMCIRLGVL